MRRTITLSPHFGFPSCGESLQVAASPCWEMALPDVISASLSLDAWTSTAVPREVLLAVSSLTTSAFPTRGLWVGVTQLNRSKRLPAEPHFAVVIIPYRSGLQVCSPPRSPPPLRPDAPQGGRGFYVRAELVSLPPRASDMLAVRIDQLTARGLAPR